MSTATETKAKTEEVTALRDELKEANDKIETLEREVRELEDDAPDFDVDWVVAKVEIFADPANWTETDGKYIWMPYMAMTERDPTTLADQILKTLNA